MNNLVIVQQPIKAFSNECFYVSLIDNIKENNDINLAFKQLEKGFEAFNSLNNLREVVKRSKKITQGLESLIHVNLIYYKDIVGDHSTTLSLESFNETNKRTVALEGIGSFLKSIWDAIVNFFKKIWNWITGKGKENSTDKFIEQVKKDTEEREARTKEMLKNYAKKEQEIIKAIKNGIGDNFDSVLESLIKEYEEENKKSKIPKSEESHILASQLTVKLIEEAEKGATGEEALKYKALKEKAQDRIKNFIGKYKTQLNKISNKTYQHADIYKFFITINSAIGGLLNVSEDYEKDFSKILDSEDLKNKARVQRMSESFRFSGVVSHHLDNIAASTKTKSSNEFFNDITSIKIPIYDDKVLEIINCTALKKGDETNDISIVKHYIEALSKCVADINVIKTTTDKTSKIATTSKSFEDTNFNDFFNQLNSLKSFHENLNILYKKDANEIAKAIDKIDKFDKMNLDDVFKEDEELLKVKTLFVQRHLGFSIKYNIKALNTAEILIKNTISLCNEMSAIMTKSKILEKINES